MSISISLDGAGRVVLPVDVRRRLGLVAGSRLRLDVVAERIELTPEPQAPAEFVLSPTGRRVLKPTGIPFDAVAAVRAERDFQASRHLRKR